MAETESRCEYIGEPMPDIAGIGIIVGFAGQAVLSLGLAIWAFFLSKRGRHQVVHEEGSIERQIETKFVEFVSDGLMIGNDFQMLLGIAYMINVFTQSNHLDLYHMHLIFDIVSFVGISNAAALVCWSIFAAKLGTLESKYQSRRSPGKRVSLFSPRHRTTYLFALMFLALTVFLGVRLNEWDPDAEPGRCYDSHLLASPSAHHPHSDLIYVGITAAWLLIVMGSAAWMPFWRHKWLLTVAFLQFPVHFYSMVVLRLANGGKLEGSESEDDWDFGQTTAVLLLFLAFEELLKKGWRFHKEKNELLARGKGQAHGSDQAKKERTSGPEEFSSSDRQAEEGHGEFGNNLLDHHGRPQV